MCFPLIIALAASLNFDVKFSFSLTSSLSVVATIIQELPKEILLLKNSQ